MVERVADLPEHVLGFRATGTITHDEYRDLMKPIYATLERGEKLNIYFELADAFRGLDLGALWEDLKAAGSVGLKHRSSWHRMAVVTDKDWIRHGRRPRAGSRPASFASSLRRDGRRKGVGRRAWMTNDRSRWLILALVVLAQLMVVLDATIVNIALPTAQSALGFSNGSRQWIVTGYALAFGSLLPLGGRMGDVFGRRRALLIGSLGFAGASAFGGAAQSFEWLLAARVLQGAFGALLAPSGLALLTTTFTEPRDRNKAFGIFGAVVGSGAAVGLLLGGALTEYLSWRWCLYVNLFLALPVALGAMALVPSQKLPGKPSLDLPGALTAAGGLFLIVFGFDRAQIAGWSAAQTIASLVAGVALLGVFVLIELRSRQPLLPMRLLENRTRAGSYLAVLFAGVGTFGVFLFVTYYMQQTLGFSPLTSGLAFLPMIATVIVTSVGVNALLLARLGPRPLVVAGMLLDASRARPPDAA